MINRSSKVALYVPLRLVIDVLRLHETIDLKARHEKAQTTAAEQAKRSQAEI